MWQSTQLRRALPPWFVALAAAVLAPVPVLSAQTEYRVVQAENFRRQPAATASLLAAVREGVVMEGGTARSGWLEVTLEGWIWGGSVAATSRDGFDFVVTARGGENLRAEPNGTIVARVQDGLLLERLDQRPGWVKVRRAGWMWGRSLARAGAQPASRDPDTVAATGQPEAGLDRGVVGHRTMLRRIPDGDSAGVLLPETPVRVLARSGEWVRVQTEGWVRAEDLRSAAPGVQVGVTGAEVRSRPGEFMGKVLQWTVQIISIQEADDLRPEIPVGQPYVLARGPLPEAGFLYILVSGDQRQAIERLQPLAVVELVGRVRASRTQYLGNPVLELVDFAAR